MTAAERSVAPASSGVPEPSPDAGARALPPPPARVHFMGVGGVSMSGLALTLAGQGYQVSGSDATASATTAHLEARGVRITIGHNDVERAAAANLLVVTRRAVQRSSPELEAAERAGVPIMRRGELVGALMNARRGLAVAGTHGKSTTTGMLVWALRNGGHDPSFAMGAPLPGTDSTVELGAGETMAVEADEFDHQFLWLRPEVSIITNIEFDHPDIFDDQAAYDDAFRRFAENTRPGGTLLTAADDSGSVRVQASIRLPEFTACQTFGEIDAADWQVAGVEGAWRLRTPAGEKLPLPLIVPGRHNARNAAAAVATLVAIGWTVGDAATAVASFPGVGRRFESKGQAGGVTVIDDYAHHPTEIRATVRAARDHFPGRRIWAAFQPHTYSRTKALLEELALALDEADRVVLLDIYGATETDDLGVSSASIADLMRQTVLPAGKPAHAAKVLTEHVVEEDIVLTLGAGDVTLVGPALLSILRERGD